MAQKKGGLGKGYGALFAENAAEEFGEASPVVLSINDISPNKDQPRSIFDGDSLAQLAESIAEHGVLQPLVVRPMSDGSYQIVAGERRWRVAKMAGLTTVPVVIKLLSDSESSVVALIENLQREDLNPIEEAVGIKRLIEEFDMTQEQAAEQLSKSRPAIANALRLLNLPQPVLEILVEKQLTAGHARALLGVSDEDLMFRTAEDIVKRGLTVRETEKLIKDISGKRSATKTRQKPPADPFFKEVELALTFSLGRRVKIVPAKTGGTISVEFFDREDLISLVKALDDE